MTVKVPPEEQIGRLHCGHYGPLGIGRLVKAADGAWELRCPDCTTNEIEQGVGNGIT
jgi:hypothetical protein